MKYYKNVYSLQIIALMCSSVEIQFNDRMGAFKVWKKDKKAGLFFFFLIKILKEDKSTKHQKIIV